jgi:hypothetical protein
VGKGEGGDEARLAFEEVTRWQGPDACFGYRHPYKNAQPRKQAFYCPKRMG